MRLVQMFCFISRRHGVVSTDGDEVLPAVAAATAAHQPIDLVLMDLHMERMDGDAALISLRAAGQRVPVILCTANATRDDAARYRGLGFAGTLGKPFSSDQMHAAIALSLPARGIAVSRRHLLR